MKDNINISKDNMNSSKENMMKDNVYYINSVLKTPLGMTHSKLSNMELNMNSIDINKHFKGFLDSKYNLIFYSFII